MKKKFIYILLGLMLNAASAYAATNVKVEALESFDSKRPSKEISFRIREDITLGDYLLMENDTLNCEVMKVTDPKRGKRNARFYVQPLDYVRNGEITPITEQMSGKYSKTVFSKETIKEIDKAKAAEKTAVTVGGFFVKGLSSAVSLTEGMVKNEEGNRLKSGVKQVYKDSPISYVEKGQDLEIQPGDEFYLVFRIKNEEDTDEEE